MATLTINHQNNTPTQFPQLLGKNYIIVQAKRQQTQFGGVRFHQEKRPIYLSDLTINMYPPIPLVNSAGVEITGIEFRGLTVFPSNAAPYQLSGIFDPISHRFVAPGTPSASDYMLLTSEMFSVSDIDSNSLLGTPEKYINIDGNFYNNSGAYYKLRFKYHYSDGTNSGLDYSEVTIIAPQNIENYDIEYTTFPAIIEVGKGMIETLNMDKIIEAFQPNTFPLSYQQTFPTYLDFLNNSNAYPKHVSTEYLNKFIEYDYKFISKIYILKADDPTFQSTTEEVPRLTYNSQPVYYGQSIQYLGLESGMLKLNTFGLNEGDTIEFLIGLETLQSNFIRISDNSGELY